MRSSLDMIAVSLGSSSQFHRGGVCIKEVLEAQTMTEVIHMLRTSWWPDAN